MNATANNHSFMMPIPLEAHRTAQIFRARHADTAKGKQIYLNILAMYAVREYFEMLGIDTNLDASLSGNPVMQALADTGALKVGSHLVECRPVLPTADSVYVPPETWSDRLGYVAVQFDQALETATLLGFLPQANAEEISLQELTPLEFCIDAIESSPSVAAHLSEWLHDAVETGWQTLDDFFQSSTPAFSFRGRVSPVEQLINSDDSIIRCRQIGLSVGDRIDNFALVVSVKPHSKRELDIWVKVLPLGEQSHLPSDLELKLTDMDGKPVMQAQSRETEAIGLKFRGDWGDQFSIHIATAETIMVEHFMI